MKCPTCGADRELIEKILLHMQGIYDDECHKPLVVKGDNRTYEYEDKSK
jgi:hypothetical protein